METISVEKAPRAEPVAAPPTAAPVLAFFVGGCLVILLLLLIDTYRWQKSRSAIRESEILPEESDKDDVCRCRAEKRSDLHGHS